MAYLFTHGGKCCGIKVIHSLGENPSEYADEVAALSLPTPYLFTDDDSGGWEYQNSGVNFFFSDAPAESRGERVERLLAYLKERRPAGVVEIVLAAKQLHGDWPAFLEERGFEAVTKFVNSNSDNECVIYHLVYGDVGCIL